MINFISVIAIPFIILLIILFGVVEKINVFDVFLEGAKKGIEVTVKIFPTLIGLFFAVGVLRASGILEFIINFIKPILNILNFPNEIMPLAVIRSISGSASIAVGTDIMKTYGVDSFIGLITSTIMGSTETTLYTIAVYSSAVSIKKTRKVIIPALIGDVVGIVASVVIWHILS